MPNVANVGLPPDIIATKTIDQLVSFFGDGKLLDKSQCSIQLRHFLAGQSSAKLAEFVTHCLESKNKKKFFDKSGQVLQDIVNEVGRRLGYSVENGRYGGTTNEIGFDGLWNDGTNWLVVEVKTTDAYRINLDTLAEYSRKLREERKLVPSQLFTLIVVGRNDTGDLEAQVRGSRHAWNVRLVSADALIKLMYVKEEVDEDHLHAKIKQVLLPIEYTRVDQIIDLVFETQQETNQKAQSADDFEAALLDEPKAKDDPKYTPQFTPKQELEKKRSAIIKSFFAEKKATPEAVGRTAFQDEAKGLRVICPVSKKYKSGSGHFYWYALHQHNLQFLKSAAESFVVLGCMDRGLAYALPIKFVEGILGSLNKTEKDHLNYWHIKLHFDGPKLKLNLSKLGKKIDLAPYAFEIG